MKKISLILSLFTFSLINAQVCKVLFDAKKGEQAGNADWIIDADSYNVGVNSSGYNLSGQESNPSRFPTPAQSGVNASTPESFWTGGISAMAIECAKLGYIVETLPYTASITYGNASNPQDLSNYRIYVVCEPNIVFTAAEKTAIMTFVQNGGRLLMVADHETSDRNFDGWDSPMIWNDLMFNNTINSSNPFGMKFDSVDISQTTSNYTPNALDSILNSPTFGSATQMKFVNGTTLTINSAANSSAKGHFYKTGASRTTLAALCASARFGKGKVAGFGDSSPFDDNTGDPMDNLFDGWIADAGGNHRKIIMNTMLWLAKLDTFIVNLNTTKSSFCQGDSSILSVDVDPLNTYLWSTGSISSSIKVKTAGLYSVTVTNNLGQTAIRSINISVNPKPTPSITTIVNVLSIAPISGAFYQWYESGIAIVGATNPAYTPVASGQFSVEVIDPNGCIGMSPLVSFTYVNPFPVDIVQNKPFACLGDSIMLTATTGVSYIWSKGESTKSIYVKSSGIYKVTVTNASAEVGSDTINISFLFNPLPIIIQSVNVLSTNAGYTNYQWYNPLNPISGATSSQYSATTSGQYKVIVIDANGCMGESAIKNFTFTNFFAKITPKDTIVCEGNLVKLSANAGASYLWSTGETTQDIIKSKMDNYSVTITDIDGLTSTASTSLFTYPRPNPKIWQSGNTLNVLNIYAKIFWNLNYNPIDSNKNIYSPPQSGLYTARVRDQNNCEAESPTFNFNLSGIQNNSTDIEVNYYQGYLQVDSKNSDKLQLNIWGIEGRKLVEKEFSNQIVLKEIQSKIFLVEITQSNRVVYKGKFGE